MRPPSRWTRSPTSRERYSFDELRVTHEQNLVLPHVKIADLRAIYDALVEPTSPRAIPG